MKVLPRDFRLAVFYNEAQIGEMSDERWEGICRSTDKLYETREGRDYARSLMRNWLSNWKDIDPNDRGPGDSDIAEHIHVELADLDKKYPDK